MGSYLSSPTVPKVYCRGDSISTAIIHYILSDMHMDIPKELIIECMKYVGFLMYSDILTHAEQYLLFDLSLPLFPKYKRNINIRYFDLIYRSSLHGAGDYRNKYLLSQIRYKINIVIVYRSNLNTVFCIYLAEASFNLGYKNRSNHNIKMFVLRSILDKPQMLKIRSDNYSRCLVGDHGIHCLGLHFSPDNNEGLLDKRAFVHPEKVTKKLWRCSITH
eukprot:UN10642